MNYQNTQEAYLRPVINIGVRHHLRARDTRELMGGLVMKAVGKVALVLLPLVLTINMVLASAVHDIERSFTAVDNQRHESMDKNIELLAHRARFLAPDNIQQLAGQKLALFAASGDQVERFN
ncbi:MAG: hypothetical protein A2X81_12010 [Desulfobacterales bacterium GWB2_56_26]|nr:MAG: hypothetical protein A2X81_12010 [Desulfobacterales bacterium GWB2_56_26]